ncbi:unnamed protein product [Gongylonema pulchrum]|uniref:G_PROTEIN_RECEP_F1_2 domain-containing protein n=1 Tax=Gongylonema pulchrum TaxID=637853 RepID=A0A183D2T5_9BILA|nr:unnamed protein product [Gongylonema pulchrum]
METGTATDGRLCAAVEQIYVNSSLVRNLYIFELAVASLGTVVAVFMAVVIYRAKILHFNARLLLIIFSFNSAVADIGDFFFNRIELFYWIQKTYCL